tara:strand:+ start:159600 stop:159866 length:267 start_codon:yes stop_codon:yes gene_type:complete
MLEDYLEQVWLHMNEGNHVFLFIDVEGKPDDYFISVVDDIQSYFDSIAEASYATEVLMLNGSWLVMRKLLPRMPSASVPANTKIMVLK